MSNENGLEEGFIPDLGYTRSYANVNSVHPTTAIPAPEVASFQKSLMTTGVDEHILKHKLPGQTHTHPVEDEVDPLDEDDDEESIDGQKGDTEMAEPNSERTDKVHDESDDEDTEMAEPTSKRTPKLKASDAPVSPDHPGKTTREKSAVVEPYDRDTRVYLTRKSLAGSIRRVAETDGALEYVIALDNGTVARVPHAEVQPMTRVEASRVGQVPPAALK